MCFRIQELSVQNVRLILNSLKYNLRVISKQRGVEKNQNQKQRDLRGDGIWFARSVFSPSLCSGVYLVCDEGNIVSLEHSGSQVADRTFSSLSVLQKERDAFGKQGVLQSQQVHRGVLLFLWLFKSSQD